MKATWISGIVLLVASAPAVAGDDKKADPRQELKTAIPEAIRLLEKKEYRKFLEAFVNPDDLKALTKKEKIDDFAKTFGEEKAAGVLGALKSIKDAKPEMDKEGKKATYKLKEKIKDGPDEIVFSKIGKYWYIDD